MAQRRRAPSQRDRSISPRRCTVSPARRTLRGQAAARNTHARTLSVLVSMCLSVELQGPTPAWLVRLEGKEAAGVAPPVMVPVPVPVSNVCSSDGVVTVLVQLTRDSERPGRS